MKKVLIAIVGAGTFCWNAFSQQRQAWVDNQQAAREEWFYRQRAYPLGEIPTGARVNAIAEIQRIDRAARALGRQAGNAAAPGAEVAAALDASTWTLIGPRPTNSGSTYVTAGRVNAIAIDPRDNNIVYMGAAEGGVWKTTDGGVTWKPLTDDQPSLAMGAIAIDPSHPDTVYAGTGEENFSYDSYYGAGILKSTDAGAHWTNIVGPFLRNYIGSLAVHPTNGQILLASAHSNVADGAGVWRSIDGAATWTRVMSGTSTGVFFDPTNGKIAYAAIGAVGGSPANASIVPSMPARTGSLSWVQGRMRYPRKVPAGSRSRLRPPLPARSMPALRLPPPAHSLTTTKTSTSKGCWGYSRAPTAAAPGIPPMLRTSVSTNAGTTWPSA